MRNDLNFENIMKRQMQSIVELIQQRILYHTKLDEFKKVKDLKLLNLL